MPGEVLLRWMYQEERTLSYVAQKSGIDADRLIGLITHAAPTDDEVSALAAVTDIAAGDLRGPESERTSGGGSPDPLRCYTVAEVARLLNVSTDSVRAEMKAGALEYVVFGTRVHRIPRWALEQRLARRDGERAVTVPDRLTDRRPGS